MRRVYTSGGHKPDVLFASFAQPIATLAVKFFTAKNAKILAKCARKKRPIYPRFQSIFIPQK